jgi:hypothetical protein
VTGRSFALSLAVTAVVCGAAGYCTRPDPAPLPAKTQARVTRHAIQSAADSNEIKRLAGERDRAAEALAAQIAITKQTEVVAQQYQRAADTLQKVAIVALTAADSARAWHAAYDARTHEAEQLRLENTQKDSSLAIARLQATVADSASLIWAGHAARSDTLIAELLPLAQQRDRCKILWVVNCPSRKAVAIGGAVLGAAAVVVGEKALKGGIRIRLPL